MRLSDREIYAYVAGFLDGEGSCYVVREKREGNLSGFRYSSHMEMTNTNLAVLSWIKGALGMGKITKERRKEGHKPVYVLRFLPDEQRTLLPKLLPYLIVKRRQAELLLQLLDLNDRNNDYRYSRNRDELKHEIWMQIRQLNKRGTQQLDLPEFQGKREWIKKPLRICSVEGCEEKHYAKGYCRKHYRKIFEYPKVKLKRISEREKDLGLV